MKKRLGILSIGALIAFAVFSLNNGNGASATNVVTPAITASGVCVNDHVATISGQTSGFPDGEVLLFAQRGDLDFGSNSGTANAAYSFSVDVYNDLGPQTGSLNFDIFAQQGVNSVSQSINVDFSKCQPPVVSVASATFKLECVAQHPLLTAQVTVTGPDPAPDKFLTLVTTSGSLDPDVQDINWVTRDYAVMQADAFGAATGASLTANLVLGTTTVSSQTFTVPDCAPEVTTTTAAPTTTTEAPATTAPATTAPATTQPASTTVATGQPPVPPTGLPKTGSNTGWQALGAFLLLLIGTALVMVTRRRSQLS